MSDPIRVLHCPQLVGGNPGQLALAEREIGLQSLCISFERHPLDYPCDEVLWDSPGSVIINELKRLRLLWRAMREFDVIHFNFGMPILPTRPDSATRPDGRAWGLWRSAYNRYASLVEFRDLALLKKLGKPLFVTFQGSDARQGAFCKAHFPVSPVGEVDARYYTAESDARKKREIAIFERYADGIYALNPDLLHVLPPRARFLPYGHIDPRKWQPVAPPGAGSRPLVIHAPSHRGVKGTRFVLDAVSRLQAEGIGFDFTLVEGMRNEDARRIYEKADLLIDQLLVGWYGGLAVECMALGKPVICYVREGDLRHIEPEMRSQLPIIRAEPSTLYNVLKEYLTTRRHQLPEIGAHGRAYVERWHDPLGIARFLLSQYVSALQRRGRVFSVPPSRPGAAPAVASRRPAPKHILVISFSDLADDPRVQRQLALLCERHEVTAVGFGCPGDLPVRCLAVPDQHWSGLGKAVAALLLKAGRFEAVYWSSRCVKAAREATRGTAYDLVIANEVWTLPLALELKGKAKVLLDAHEYTPLEFEESWRWRFFFRNFNEYLCRHYLPLADAATTVCEGIADEYHRTLGVQMTVIHNAPPYQELRPSRATADGRIRLVHHGRAIPSRQLETMIETARLLDDRYTLDFVLVPGNSRYLDHLKSLARDVQRIRFLPPVGMHELPRFLNRYDAGIYLLPPNNFNNRHSLPNKFFEFIQARLAVAIGPSPEMARLVRQYGCGVVAEDFSPRKLAALLNSLSHDQIDRFKQRSHEAARHLCFENNATTLLAMLDGLVGHG